MKRNWFQAIVTEQMKNLNRNISLASPVIFTQDSSNECDSEGLRSDHLFK